MQGNSEKGVSGIFFCLFCFILVIMLPFIVCDLYFAYNDSSYCLVQPIKNYSISFNLRTWLLVEGYGNLAVVAILLLVALLSCCSVIAATGLLVFALCLMIIYSVFRLAWLIVGALMFWGDVMGNCDSQIYSYMWALLIINFVGTFCNVVSSHRARSQGTGGDLFGGIQLN